MAGRLVRAAPPEMAGYLVGDANFDSNRLHAACEARGDLQLVKKAGEVTGEGFS